ncbi:MAG: TVP38/TMEM64 family protein [Propylenella sp.]
MQETGKSGLDGSGGKAGRFGAAARWAPLVAVAAALAVGYALGLQDYLSLSALRQYQGSLAAFVEANPVAAPLAYLLVYVVAVTVSFPGASFLTIAGGFLFGAFLGTGLAVVAATIGATLIFLIARTSLGELLAQRAGPRVQRLRRGFQEEGFSYLLFLRLVPLFPFWLVNLAAALFGMRVLPYVAATAIGIVPATFVFSYFGQGLGSALESEGSPASLELFAALALLGVLALVPVAVRKWRRGREAEPGVPS